MLLCSRATNSEVDKLDVMLPDLKGRMTAADQLVWPDRPEFHDRCKSAHLVAPDVVDPPADLALWSKRAKPFLSCPCSQPRLVVTLPLFNSRTVAYGVCAAGNGEVLTHLVCRSPSD
jgi:hypothetical protein